MTEKEFKRVLTDSEVKSVLSQLTAMSSNNSLELQHCIKGDGSKAFVAFIYHHITMGSMGSCEPEVWEDYDIISLLNLADFIDSQSTLDHLLAEDLRAYYYAYVPWDKFAKSKECLDFMCEHFKDLSLKEAGELMKSIFYTYQQLYRTLAQIKDIDYYLDGGEHNSDTVIAAMEAWRDLDIDATNLKWELESLLNK